MQRLRPSILEDLGLAETLRQEVDAWQTRHPKTRCTLSMNADLSGLQEQTAITIYRIVQESLTNIAKHANASNVSINFDVVDDFTIGDADSIPIKVLRFSIRDDGVGMDSKPARGRGLGLGLIGIRERASALCGEMNIQTTNGQGLEIIVTLPLSRWSEGQ
jgi:signal transduction histidine kinase